MNAPATTPHTRDPLLPEGYGFGLDHIVRWNDLDAFGVVNNVEFIRFLEHARVGFFDFLSLEGMMGSDLSPGNGGLPMPIVSQIDCRYRAPIRYPDELLLPVRVRPGSVFEYGYQIDQLIISRAQQGKVCAEAVVTLFCYDYQARAKMRLPDDLRALLVAQGG
jgi:acyl-CoA thioester hydrolase